MRIGIDARLAGPDGRGIGRTITELLANLAALDRTNEYVCVVREGMQASDFPRLPERTKLVHARSRWYTLAEQLEMPRLFARGRCDLAHIPHFNVPLRLRIPFVVTIHDLILRDLPFSHASLLPKPLFWAKRAAYGVTLRRAVHRAQRIIVPSEYMRTRLAMEFPKSERRIVVAREGAFNSRSASEQPDASSQTPFVLYVGSAYPHKNLSTLCAAVRELRREMPNLELRIVGKRDAFMGAFAVREEGNGVHFLGAVSDVDLTALYREASVVALVSLEEGFGLPALEAISYGASVLASDRSSLPEVCEKLAVLVNPYNVHDVIRGLRTALQQQRITAPNTHNQWQSFAATTLQAYEEAMCQ